MRLSNAVSHLPYMCVHVHPSLTHMFTCMDKVTLRVFHQNSMEVLPGNWEMGGGVLICFKWTFSMVTASWCEPVRRDTCGTLTQWQRSSWSSDPIKKQGVCVGVGGKLKSCLLWHFSCQTESRKSPWRSRATLYILIFVSLSCFPKLMGHDLDKQSMIRTEEADITDNWRLSPQASESFIASFKVKCCLF